MEKIQKITPFLWFDTNAEEAAKFYTAIFQDSAIDQTSYYPEGAQAPAGSVMVVSFHLCGQKFTALNGGPMYKFTEAISMMVHCESQEEIDHYWKNLCEGGKEIQCGWLKDKFGLSWQIVPAALGQLLKGDAAQSARVMHALWKMTKIDIAKLKEARDAKE